MTLSSADTFLSGSLEGAGGIGGLLARSHDFTTCNTALTVTITNDSEIGFFFWIYDDANNTIVDGEGTDTGAGQEFAFESLAGEYTKKITWGGQVRESPVHLTPYELH